MKRMVILNPKARHGTAEQLVDRLRLRLKPGTERFEVQSTRYRGHATQLAREALKAGFDHLIAVGGDGTFSEMVNGFYEAGQPLNLEAMASPLMLGTGCDFGRSYGLPKGLTDQLNRLTQGREYRIDLGKVTLGDQVRYFVNIGGFGLSGQVNQILEQQKGSLGFLSGKAAFFLASLRGILTGKNAKVRLVIDGGPPVEMTSKLVALANGQFFGGGMWIAPQASNEDGWLDLVVLGDLSAWETLRQFPLVYQGLHLGRPGVLCQKITVLEASSEEPVWVDLDGEVVGQLPARFEVVRQGLKVWV